MTSPLANAPGGQLGIQVARNLSASTLVKAGPGAVLQLAVITAGSGNGAIYDSTGSVAQTGQIAAIPQTVGTYDISFPCFTAILVVPGTGQLVAVSYQ